MSRVELSGEEWRPVPGFEGIYEASNFGRVYSVKRPGVSRSGRILTPTPTPAGHLSISLRRNRARLERRVHQVVLLAFVGPCPEGQEVRHMNGDPTDNRLENLRYDTKRANTLDRALHRDPDHRTPLCRNGHPYSEANTYYVSTRPEQRMCRTCYEKRTSQAKAEVAA